MPWAVFAGPGSAVKPLGALGTAALAVGGAETGLGTGNIRHEAFLYRGDVGFLSASRDFVLAGLAADEDVLIMLSEPRMSLLRGALGRAGRRVEFIDIVEVGRNPARLIPTWQEFIEKGAEQGRVVRGIGEPVWSGRTGPELAECMLHEALTNEAFPGPASWRLRCIYESSALDPATDDLVWRTHPLVVKGGLARPSTRFHPVPGARGGPVGPAGDLFAEPLSDLGPPWSALSFGPADLGLVRAAAAAAARAVRLGRDRVGDLELSVHEVATNSVRHGGGQGTVRFWPGQGGLVCEVADAGQVADRLAGRRRPALDLGGGRGLWLVNQLCDLVQLRSAATGTTVRMFIH
ncbi:serine/threonine-protein kinase RsbW [Frankia sp. AiPs1]|uniref:anti-sigma factor RsbA family regulatory protein n=1 Tax=Frankia sp. AiPa1 TaxID=573492 RepID=UPI00202AD158|nr:anti-sigma factor RsbA family regulatory protein [Frankia sp. AiPa1]MCL9762900.1 sensor histidine kinase [Frankia sp. AiPa1]